MYILVWKKNRTKICVYLCVVRVLQKIKEYHVSQLRHYQLTEVWYLGRTTKDEIPIQTTKDEIGFWFNGPMAEYSCIYIYIFVIGIVLPKWYDRKYIHNHLYNRYVLMY